MSQTITFCFDRRTEAMVTSGSWLLESINFATSGDIFNCHMQKEGGATGLSDKDQ